MSNPEDCFCKTDGVWHKRMEYFMINGSRIELRCCNCNGLVNWWMEHPRTRNIIPAKRGWSDEDRRVMR
jgi:hypothetical protein